MQSRRFPLGTKPLPAPLPLRRLIGPSFIILGLGLGSGEVILWPYLASNYGLGIVWAMLAGITMQFFINMEVERYALAYGESIFVGFARMLRWLPGWFILSTFLGFGWPGIGLAGATLLSHTIGDIDPRLVSIAAFLATGAILSIGAVLYTTVETLQKWLIGIGVPFIILLTVLLADWQDVTALAAGFVGRGEGFTFLPEGISLATFLGALAYAGAGGNLNLAQSFYVRDKGYGMGAYADRITSVITGRGGATSFRLTGQTFPLTAANLRRFRTWWRTVNIEHLVVFWFLGLLTMSLLTLLAYATTFGVAGNAEGITFVLNEAVAIGHATLPMVGALFLAVTGVMLLATQLTVLDSTSRIMTENVLLLATPGKKQRVSRVYYIILWLQIAFGIGVVASNISQPRELITLGAVFNACSMFVYTGLLLFMSARLPQPLRPSAWRILALLATFVFLGGFCVVTVGSLF